MNKEEKDRLFSLLERIAVAMEKQQAGQPVVIPAGSACGGGPGYREYIHPDGGRTIFGNPHANYSDDPHKRYDQMKGEAQAILDGTPHPNTLCDCPGFEYSHRLVTDFCSHCGKPVGIEAGTLTRPFTFSTDNTPKVGEDHDLCQHEWLGEDSPLGAQWRCAKCGETVFQDGAAQ